MSYLTVDRDGFVGHVRRAPTVSDVAKSIPGRLRPVDCGRLLAWVTHYPQVSGPQAANVGGSILLWCAGAPPVPYVGPLVLTGAHFTRLYGFQPFPLPVNEAARIIDVTEAIRRTLDGTPGLWDPGTADAIRDIGKAVQASYEHRQEVVFDFRHGIGPLGLAPVRARLHTVMESIEVAL